MTPAMLLTTAAAGLFLACLAAIAVRALHDFSRRELEQHCQRRKRLDRFGDILDNYEDVTGGAESLQVIGIVLLVLGGVLGFHRLAYQGNEVGTGAIALAAVSGSLVLALVTAWIPAAVSRLWSAAFLFHTWPFWQVVHRLLWPMTLGGRICDLLLRRLADRPPHEDDEEEAFEDEIRSIVTEGLHDGVLEADAREMIEGVIELSDETVSHIMTPRSNMDAFDIRFSWPEALRFVVEAGRTRIPVYENHLDNVVGVLYVKDLLGELSTHGCQPRVPLANLLRKPWFVPTTKALDEMLQEFLQTRNHLAIVVDEYRAVAGVVTIEDVLEEIVGEIVDESDKEEVDLIRRLDATTAEVLGITHVDMINERLSLELPEPEECDTIAGLIISQLGSIPKNGDVVVVGDVRITVLEATRRRVDRVRIERIPSLQEPSTTRR